MKKLKNYKPTKFMLDSSHYDKNKADYAVTFIECLKHTKGRWAGKPFKLIDWQEEIIRDLFGIVKETGYRQFNTAYIEIPKKQGKQLDLNTLIPTPNGFTTMGKIRVGDVIFDEKGNQCNVVAKSKVDYKEQAYKIKFKDGEEIIAGARHEWVGQITRGKRKDVTITTEELFNMPRENESCLRFRIKVAEKIKTEYTDLEIDPYLMGYWLGNGNAVKPELTIQTCDVVEVLNKVWPNHKIGNRWQNNGDSKVVRIPELRKILLKSFHDKVIPMIYLRASVEQRLELLQGLMDSDGSISTIKGQAIYTSTEKALSESVSELLWSLGIKNAITKAPSTIRNDMDKPSDECGRRKTGETLYYVKFTAFDDLRIASLKRKQKNAVKRNPRTRSHYRYIESIEKVKNKGMQCIQVDSPSHQYLVGRSFLPTHNSELAAAVALLLTCGDGEERAEVYGCAADRQQATIVFDVAADMVRMSPALSKRVKILASQKRMIYKPTNSFYQVLSAEAYSKHGFNIHGVVFDELHTQPNRKLFDVMTKGSGDARTQPLYFLITTAGTDTKSICYETHQKAVDILEGRKTDSTFYPVIYGADREDDWTDEKVWYKANPSLGITVPIEKVRQAFNSAKQNPAEENSFRQLRLNQWVKQAIRWMPMDKWDACNFKVNEEELKGRVCYGGLDLSSTTDITAFVLVFPPLDEDDKFQILPYFWLPEDNLDLRVKRDHVNYDLWQKQGYLQTTEGNVVHYGFIEKFIEYLGEIYNIREIAFDRWGAVQMVQNLEGMGFTVVPFGQGFKDMSPPTKELMKLTLERKIAHGGHPVLRWMMDNIFIRTDPAGNIKADKEKSTEKIDGVIATIMALDRAIRCGNDTSESVYDDRGLIVF
ncbi:terminase [Anaerococcus sp. AGMB00486]|uniref:Terminase n=1 Tax=Anaerococcus faecalis TaxID=2742993 RepID=A0ABX2NAC4_9FIRM|nr:MULTISPECIES: terminase TerL endonuclease subunit [Anaerococcus]MDY3006319.1 terminase TerL endonuclease subunit [Anaerococcus porci]NVF11625.1 terminase [Anaerococcus faecalis]